MLETLAKSGGGAELAFLSRPHIGTDLLRQVVVSLRSEIRKLGGEVRFGVRFSGVERDGSGRVSAAVTSEGERIETNAVILAIGHSARDTFRALYGKGLRMERKSFSMGFRIEHLQQIIDEAQYGKDFNQIYGLRMEAAGMPKAEYKLAWRGGQGRGVYTFCMCPGGQVISVASERGGVCTNGMSNHARDGYYANSAVLADVAASDFDRLLHAVPDLADSCGAPHPSDLSDFCGAPRPSDAHRLPGFPVPADPISHGGAGMNDAPEGGSPLTGLILQRKIERAAFEVSLAAFVRDQADQMVKTDQRDAQGKEGVRPHGYTPLKETLGRLMAPDCLLRQCLPAQIIDDILEAMPHFGRKIPGFDGAGVAVIGPETRSSSPLRIPRDREGHSNIPGLFPCGEGAGYAGGIMSAAIDGIRAAEAVLAGAG